MAEGLIKSSTQSWVSYQLHSWIIITALRITGPCYIYKGLDVFLQGSGIPKSLVRSHDS